MSRRHQAHITSNRNGRRSKLVQQSLVTSNGSNDLSIFELERSLRVQPNRDFEYKVDCIHDPTDDIFKEASNPENQLGGLFEQCVPLATVPDYASFLSAFNKRANFLADDDIDDFMFHEAKMMIDSLPNLFEPWQENDVDRQRWLNKFSPSKQKRMNQGWLDVPDTPTARLGDKDLMVKQEILIKRDDPEWAPRLVYVGTDAYNAATGPCSMVVMERMVQLTQQSKIGNVHVKFAYKTNDVELAEFINDPALPHRCEGDFSRNDKEQRKRVHILFNLFLHKINMPQWYVNLLTVTNKFTVRHHLYNFKAFIENQLPTGGTHTTTRNSFYNMIMFAVVCKLQKTSGKAIILGDDILASLIKRLNIRTWVEQVAQFKMVLKGKSVELDGEATFLSRRFVTSTPTPCMIPLIGKMLIRFNARSNNNQAVSDNNYIAGKALSYAYECRHIPILRDAFMERYHAEYNSMQRLELEDLTWFARQGGMSTEQIIAAVINETVIVNNDDFECWLITNFDSDLIEMESLINDSILNPIPQLVDNPLLLKFASDY
jgi:hypothetical protein